MCIVEIIYASLKQQELTKIKVRASTTINEVIIQSGILGKFPEIDLVNNKVGIYNQIKKLEEIVKDGDRVEIYRPLIADPKEVRRKRAEKQKQDGVI